MKLTGTLFSILGATLLAASSAQAEKFAVSGWSPPNHVMTVEIHQAWADAMRKGTGGKIDFDVFSAGALLPPLSTMQGVRDGVAQAGHVAAPYHPAEFPVNNLVGDIGHSVGDTLVLAAAYLDFSMNDPVGFKEWRDNGNLPINAVATPLNRYICRSVIRTLDDLKGKRIRTPGGGWSRAAQHLGAIPVNLPFNEAYTALERGAVDCVLTDATNLTRGLTLVDLTKSVLMMPFQPGFNVSQLAMNPTFWRARSNDERRMMLNESAVTMAKAYMVYNQAEADALAASRAKGVQIIEPDATLKASYAKWVADGFGDVAGFARDRLKIADPQKVMTSFQTGYLDKWTKLLANVDRKNQAAVVSALRTNLFDKIDVATWGMR